MIRTDDEIKELKEALLRQRAAMPEYSMFGTNNHEIIDGQIRVLDGEFTDRDEVYDYYGGDETAEEFDESEMEMANDIVLAFDWLDGDTEADELVDEEYLNVENL